MELQFDCIFYYVSDLERSIAFYRDVLGFRLASKDAVARFDLDGVLFELVPAGQAEIDGTGNARLGLKVDDIAETVRQLSLNRVRSSEVESRPGGLISFFRDPDGNEICLWQYVRS